MKLKLLNEDVELYKDDDMIIKISKSAGQMQIITERDLSPQDIEKILEQYLQ